MPTAPRLARRAAIAVLLTLGFYLLALGIAGLLLYLPYAEWTYVGQLHLKLALVCILAAGVIIWSIMPRWDRFVPPGPQLRAADHPELFRHLREVAVATGQPLPAEVYAVAEMNAWVMDRGGLLGLGSRRVMALGLPLLKILTVSQARAVIAHEFGHFYGGDTKLGPWIFRTRQALGRTIDALGEQGSVLQKPFLWYGNAFLKITQGISRGQEFTADRLAAETAGGAAMKSALTALHRSGHAFDSYWENEFTPALQRGYYPPLLEGYAAFIATPAIAAALEEELSAELAAGESDPFASHPALRERLAALRDEVGPQALDATPALLLLGEVAALEVQLVKGAVDPAAHAAMQPLDWHQAAEQVWLPFWEERIQDCPVIPAVTLAELPGLLENRADLARQLTGDEVPTSWEEERDALLAFLLGATLTVTLARRGWRISTLPGAEVLACRGEHQLHPFAQVKQLVSGELSRMAWQELCAGTALSDIPLAPAVA